MYRFIGFLKQYWTLKKCFQNDQHSDFQSTRRESCTGTESWGKVLFCTNISISVFQCSNEKVQIISFKLRSVHFYYKENEVQSFTISRRQSGNSTIRRWTWYNFKYDTLFVMNRRKQISIDVQSFIICLQIIVSSCRSVHDFSFERFSPQLFCYALVRQVISLSHSAPLIQKAQFKAERFFIPRTTPYVESEKTNMVLADSFVYKPPAWKHRALWPDHHHDHELNWLELNSHLFGSERCNLFFFR